MPEQIIPTATPLGDFFGPEELPVTPPNTRRAVAVPIPRFTTTPGGNSNRVTSGGNAAYTWNATFSLGAEEPEIQDIRTTPPPTTPASFYRRGQDEVIGIIYRNHFDAYSNLKKAAKKAVEEIKGKSICSFCGKHEDDDKVKVLGGKRKICEKCLPLYTKCCSGCDRLIVHANYRNDNDPAYYSIQFKEDKSDERWYCYPCADKSNVRDVISSTWVCHTCGCMFSGQVKQTFVNPRTGKIRCGNCQTQTLASIETRVLSHNANVLDYLMPYPAPKSKLQFGVELEVQHKGRDSSTKIAMVRNIFPGFAVCVHDGTVTRRVDTEEINGFEIVTVPGTIEEHRREWPKLLSSKHGLFSWKTGDCGMHVHITRDALSVLQIGRMLEFINSPDNYAFICKMAGRQSSDYNKFLEKKLKDSHRVYKDGTRLYAELVTTAREFHYEALNLINKSTVELRIFRGNMKPESFFKNLEFTAALVAFCKDASNNGLTVSNFVAFIDKNRSEFPFLVRFLIKTKFMVKNERPSKGMEVTTRHKPIHMEFLAKRRELQALEASYDFGNL